MVEVTKLPKEIAENPAWRNSVTRADEWIRDVLRRWVANKNFTWHVNTSQADSPRFDLLIESDGFTVSDRFNWFDLNNEKEFKSRIRELWGKISDQTFHNELEEMRKRHAEWQKEAAVGD
jgi:hypothetical protein